MLGINRLVILKFCVKAEGMSLTEIKEILQITINEQKYSDDSKVQATFKKYFGNKIPTPEEYIYTMMKHSKIKFYMKIGRMYPIEKDIITKHCYHTLNFKN